MTITAGWIHDDADFENSSNKRKRSTTSYLVHTTNPYDAFDWDKYEHENRIDTKEDTTKPKLSMHFELDELPNAHSSN